MPVDADTDFFDAGGTSLAAMQIISALEERCGKRVPLRVLFDNPRFEEFVAALARVHHSAEGEHARVWP
jgi:acyl carrier protein